MDTCPRHDNTHDLKHHADEIVQALRTKTQDSVQKETKILNRVLKRVGQVTGGAVIATVAVAGVLPILPMVSAGLPAAFATGALMGWAQNIGTSAVGDWLVGAANRAANINDGSSISTSKKEEWIFDESNRLLQQMLDGDIQLIIGISKIIKDDQLLEIYEESLDNISSGINKAEEGKQIYSATREGIAEAKQIINRDVFNKVQEVYQKNKRLESENQVLTKKNEELHQNIFTSQEKFVRRVEGMDNKIQLLLERLKSHDQIQKEYERVNKNYYELTIQNEKNLKEIERLTTDNEEIEKRYKMSQSNSRPRQEIEPTRSQQIESSKPKDSPSDSEIAPHRLSDLLDGTNNRNPLVEPEQQKRTSVVDDILRTPSKPAGGRPDGADTVIISEDPKKIILGSNNQNQTQAQ